MKQDIFQNRYVHATVSLWSERRRLFTTVFSLILFVICTWFFHFKNILKSIDSYSHVVVALPDIQKNIRDASQRKDLLERELKEARMSLQSHEIINNATSLLQIITESRLVLDKWEILPASDGKSRQSLIKVVSHARFDDLLSFLHRAAQNSDEFILNQCTILRKDDSSLECRFIFVFNENVA